MAELIPTASEAEWLEARRKGVTASEIAVIMGLSPYSSPYALYHQKLGILPADEDQAVFERGRVLEPYVAEKFAAAHPEFAVLGDGRGLYAHGQRAWQLATPDRVIGEVAEVDECTCGQGPNGYYGAHERGCGTELAGPLAVLECKTDAGSDEWGEEGTDEIPVHYRCQALWQMDVMGVAKAHVSCLRVHDWKIREYVIEMDDSARRDLALMVSHAKVFLADLETGNAPDVDWRPATAYALKQLHPSVTDEDVLISSQLGKWYRAACRNYKRAEQKKKLYEARIREAMGSAHTASMLGIGREPLVRRDVYEVKAHERKASTVDKLVPVYPKERK